MAQAENKHMLAIFVGAIITLRAETCMEGGFQLQENLCCPKCDSGMFVVKNCSTEDPSVNCVQCSTCKEGQVTVSECSLFSDTQCSSVEGGALQFTMLTSGAVLLTVLLLAVICTATIWSRTHGSGSLDKRCAEPFCQEDPECGVKERRMELHLHNTSVNI